MIPQTVTIKTKLILPTKCYGAIHSVAVKVILLGSLLVST